MIVCVLSAEPSLTITASKPGIVCASRLSSACGKNAALLAVEMLALSDDSLAAKLKDFRKAQADKVLADDAALQESLQK